MANNNLSCDVVVIGAGPAGLTAAIALASADIETLLIGATPTTTDHRTTALLTSSVAALDALGIWERCRDQAASLKIMRIADDRPVLLRAPEVAFEAAEIGHEAFGYNIENRTLVAALSARAATLSALRHVERNARELTISEMDASITLDDGTRINTRLIIAADGRNSLCRSAAGIAVRTHRYPQTALALTFDHTRPHRDTSIEFHTEAGPFTLVPLPGQRSSLVWVDRPETVAERIALDDDALALAIERRAASILGKVTIDGKRQSFPLSGMTPARFARSTVSVS